MSMQDLVRQTLRMRPDRLVVGEVRGAEVVDLLTAFNTGHEGGCGTVHANSAADVVPRLEALAALGGLRREALQRLVVAAIDAVVHLERAADGDATSPRSPPWWMRQTRCGSSRSSPRPKTARFATTAPRGRPSARGGVP